MNDIRDLADKLGVLPSALSPLLINAFFLSLTPRVSLKQNHSIQLAENPALEREKTLWRPSNPSVSLELRWKVFLSCLPPYSENWNEMDQQRHSDYMKYCEEFEKEINIFEKENTLKTYASDYVSSEPKSIQDENLRSIIWEIKKDVRRTYFNNNVLKNRFTIHKLLLIYCLKFNQDYVQGMNEIIAILFEITANCSSDLRESETFTLFTELMDIMGDWFKGGDEGVLWIRNRCESILSIISQKDEELAIHLKTSNVEVELFLLRWVRLLFCQVFPITSILLIWDVIFAYSGRLSLVDHICVVMIILQRKAILEGDAIHSYGVLFNYPIDDYSVDFIIIASIASCIWYEQPMIRPLDFKKRILLHDQKKQNPFRLLHKLDLKPSKTFKSSPSHTPNLIDRLETIEKLLKHSLQGLQFGLLLLTSNSFFRGPQESLVDIQEAIEMVVNLKQNNQNEPK
ncbi:Rab-GAP TBC domain-containing protein [Entamoeba marina]